MTLQDLLASRYEPHGRTLPRVDCWGIVRIARAELFGKPLLPSYADTDPQDARGLTRAADEVTAAYLRHTARLVPGAVLDCRTGRLCVHVAIAVAVDGRMMALETTAEHGPRLTPLHALRARYREVRAYD